MYRVQKNITISDEQKKFIENNHGKMNIGELSKMLGLTYNVTHKNLGLMGMVKKRKARIVTMEGYFDLEEFAKKYKY